MTAERKPSGRPLRYGAKLQTVQVTLDAESIRRGRELGNDNLSRGIRAALNPLQVPGPASPASPGALPADTAQPAI